MELAWEEVVENNAWTSKGWRPCPISSSDPARFTTNDYRKFRHPKDIPLPASDCYHEWVWCGDWNYGKWRYCKKWDRNELHWSTSLKQGKSARCRRRMWKRPRVRNDDDSAQECIREIVYENQRYLVKRWASPYLPKDRPHWSDVNGTAKTLGSVNNKLAMNWKWLAEEWQTQSMQNETDDDGWQYAPDFDAVNWAPKRTILHHVRRRQFTRTRMRSNKEKTVQTRMIRSVSDAANRGFDGHLVVSYTNQFKLEWSTRGVIESSGYQCSIWSPKLGANEYCLGYLLSAEKSYPRKTFLVIVKKQKSDKDALRRPTALTLIWSTRFNEPSAAIHGHFYKAVAPPGYVALGDVAISKKKGAAPTLHDFPKLMCLKKEFADKYSQSSNSLVPPHTMIWNTKKLGNTAVHCQLWTQPPFSNEVESPFFVCAALEKPGHVYPRLNIRHVLQDEPDNITVFASFMTKKGKGVGSPRKRFFILTSERQLQYFESDECRVLKGTVDLQQMTGKAKVQQSNTEKFAIPTTHRKWLFTCNSRQDSIHWVNEINAVWQNPKAVLNDIIAAQIQGQGQPAEDYKSCDAQKATDPERVTQLFDAPLPQQVLRLLLRNINIIKKILKGDHHSIQLSVLDQMFKGAPVAKKKRSSFKQRLSIENKRASSMSSSACSLSDEFMSCHNENKESIYKYFDDAWRAVKLLLKHFDGEQAEEKQPQPQVIRQIASLSEQSIKYIMNKITSYVQQLAMASNSSADLDPFESSNNIISMCDACAVVETLPLGRQTVVAHITNDLLKDIAAKYASGSQFAGCAFVERRFEDYRKRVGDYESVYSFFIPAKWIVPVTFSLQFCKLTGDQIDEHLKQKPETTQMVMRAKQICVQNEQKLQQEARKFLSLPQTELGADEIEHTLPHYVGMISAVLDRHLNSYISAERAKAEECVLSAKNETFSVLSEDGSLTEMYEGGATKNSSQKHKSCESLLVAIRVGFKKCLHISRGQQLVDLLLAHQQYLSQYHDILSDLTREALQTNGTITISAANRREHTNTSSKLTERYLWFAGYADEEKKQESVKKRDRNQGDVVIQQVLTFLVLVYNSALYCKDSMLNLGKASHKAIEINELKQQVDFRPLHQQFETLQFKISERLSQCIMCRIVQDLSSTYKQMDFANMSERDYIFLEKCRYLVESAWSNLVIQLLYIMPIAHYKFMIKRCVYLLAEYIFESTLALKHINSKIVRLLLQNYTHIKSAILTHLGNESQHLASEIEVASNVIFAPTDVLYDLLCTANEAIPALLDDDEDLNVESMQNGFTFETLKTKIGQNIAQTLHVDVDVDAEPEPVFYKKYTLFEMKVVDFYHSSNVVLCFQTLLLQLAESQIKVNRSTKSSVKPTFFEAFDFAHYTKPQQKEKLALKERLISKIMQCKGIDKDTQKIMQLLYREKTTVDMKQEQQDSIYEAIQKKEAWEQEQKENKIKAQKEASAMTFFNKTPTAENTNESGDALDAIAGNMGDIDDDDVIVMKQTVDVKDVDNTIVVAAEPEPQRPAPVFAAAPQAEVKGDADTIDTKPEVKIEFDVVEKDTTMLDEEVKEEKVNVNVRVKRKISPPSYRPPPPKVPNTRPPPPPIPRGASPSPALSNSSINMANKPPIPMHRPPPKPITKPTETNNNKDGLFKKWFGNDGDK